MPTPEAIIDVPVFAKPKKPSTKKKKGRFRVRGMKLNQDEKASVGRPPVMTDEVVQKLLEARADGATDVQACLLAEIGVRTYYDYCSKYPDFSQMMDRAAEILSVMAQRKLRKALDALPIKESVDLAWRILQEDRRASQPGAQGGVVPRLGSMAPSTQVQINVGGQQIPIQTKQINAEDLTDDELYAISSGQKTLQQVLGDRELITPRA